MSWLVVGLFVPRLRRADRAFRPVDAVSSPVRWRWSWRLQWASPAPPTRHRTRRALHLKSRPYHYPAADQPHPHGLTSVTTVGGARNGQTDSFVYDDDGNTKTRQIGSSGAQQQPEQDFVWDLEGHLSSVTKSGQTTSFVYDADGNRLIQHAPDAATLYVAGEEIRLATGSTTPVCTRYYSYGGQTIASRTTSGLTWLVSDQHGTSDVSVGGDAAQAVNHRRFTPFGQQRGTPPTTWQGTRGFVGGTIDTALGGLTQLGAREYDPGTGRFLSVDPVFDGSDTQSLNGYSYADDNPTSLSDPSGLMVPCDTGAGGCGMTGHAGGGSGKGPCDIVDCSHVPPPAPRHHCGWTCSVGNFWNKHKAVIVNVTVTIVVTAGCEAATGGTGSLGCAVVGGMAGNWAGYAVSTPQNQQTLGGALKAEAWGAVQGAASWGLAKAGGLLLGKVATTAGGRAITKAISKASSGAKGAIGKIASKAVSGGADAAEDTAGASGAKAAVRGGAKERASQEAVGSKGEGLHVALGRNNPLVENEVKGAKVPFYWKDSLRQFAHEWNAVSQHDSEFDDLKGLGPAEYARAIVDRAVNSSGRISFSLRGVDTESILAGDGGG